MDEVKLEVHGYFLLDKCKCCLGDGLLKDLWGEYCEDGEKEIYGEMLNECFGLAQYVQFNPENVSYAEKICESCICRLRDALEFKQEVVACGQLRLDYLNNGCNYPNNEIEKECLEKAEIVNKEKVQSDENTEKDEYFEEVVTKKEVEDCVEVGEFLEEIDSSSEYDPDSGSNKDANFDDVEYLELDEEEVAEDFQITSEGENQSSQQDREKKKWPQRKKEEKMKMYKQYIREDMTKALEAVQSGLLSTKNAAKEFNVPRKTLASKLLNAERGKAYSANENPIKTKKKEDHYQFIEEVKKILTYTNAVPFRTKATRYFCAYCSTDGPCFEDADELRAHTRTEHVDDKTRNIEIALRPQHQNEVMKIDIDALHCTVCCTIIPTWMQMFQHLEESHNIELDQAYTKVIPYILKRDLKCALCNASFPNYHHLDGHMNSHYASYICSECGDTFLSASRLTKHIKVHNTGRFPCEACGKIFARDRYRQKHFDHVHKQEHNIRCVYCPEKFYGTFQRHLHMVEKHKEKVRITTCELCGMKFEWRRYYVAHMRRKHNIRTI